MDLQEKKSTRNGKYQVSPFFQIMQMENDIIGCIF